MEVQGHHVVSVNSVGDGWGWGGALLHTLGIRLCPCPHDSNWGWTFIGILSVSDPWCFWMALQLQVELPKQTGPWRTHGHGTPWAQGPPPASLSPASESSDYFMYNEQVCHVLGEEWEKPAHFTFLEA